MASFLKHQDRAGTTAQRSKEDVVNRNKDLSRYVILTALAAAAAFAAVYSAPPDPADAQPIWLLPLPTQVTPRWRIHIRAFPDGVGAGGQRCQGCDGSYSGGDQFVAATKPLRDVNVVVLGYQSSEVNGVTSWTEVELWKGNIAQPNSRHPGAESTIVLDQPPPYTVYLAKNPDGYALCPTAPQWRTFEPKDFQSAGGRPGAGRQVELSWFFWSCAGEALGQDLPEPNRAMGGVICSIQCWLDRARGTAQPGSCSQLPPRCTGETPTPTSAGATPVP
jgi:hypothetical protein